MTSQAVIGCCCAEPCVRCTQEHYGICDGTCDNFATVVLSLDANCPTCGVCACYCTEITIPLQVLLGTCLWNMIPGASCTGSWETASQFSAGCPECAANLIDQAYVYCDASKWVFRANGTFGHNTNCGSPCGGQSEVTDWLLSANITQGADELLADWIPFPDAGGPLLNASDNDLNTSLRTDIDTSRVLSELLQCQDFNIPLIPPDATIDGFEVRIYARDYGVGASDPGVDQLILLQNGTTTIGNDKGDNTVRFTPTPTWYTWGGPTDLWGAPQAGLTAIVNSPEFGLQLQIRDNNTLVAISRAEVYEIQLKVYYTIPGGPAQNWECYLKLDSTDCDCPDGIYVLDDSFVQTNIASAQASITLSPTL